MVAGRYPIKEIMTPLEFKTYRNALGLTSQDVAARLDMSLRTAQRMESLNPDTAIEPKPDAVAWIAGEWGKFVDLTRERIEDAKACNERGEPLKIPVYRDELQSFTETGYSLAQDRALTAHIAMACDLLGLDWVLVEK